MIFALLASLPLLAFTKPESFKILKRPPLLLVLGSLGLAYNYLGFMKGVELSGASNAQIMIQVGPLLLMVSGFVIFKESLNKLQALGLVMAFVGFNFFFKNQLKFIERGQLSTANLWIVSAAVSWVAYSLVVRHYTRSGKSSSEVNLIVFGVCSICLATGINFESVAVFSLAQWAFLFVLGLNTLIAYGCFGAALQNAPASQVSVIITTNPILTLLIIEFGASYSQYIPNEPISALGYIGASLVVTGIIFSTYFAKKSNKLKNKVIGQN